MCEVNRQQRNSLDKKNLVFFFQCRPSLTTDITTNWLHFTFFCPYRNPKHESSFSRNKHTQKVKVDTKNKIWWTSMPPSDSNYNNFVLGVRSHNSKSPSFRKKGRPLSLQKQGFHGEPSVKDTLKKKTRQRGGGHLRRQKKNTYDDKLYLLLMTTGGACGILRINISSHQVFHTVPDVWVRRRRVWTPCPARPSRRRSNRKKMGKIKTYTDSGKNRIEWKT